MTTQDDQQAQPGTADAPPQLAAMLEHLQSFTTAVSDALDHTNAASFSGTDEAETVEVTVDGNNRLTGLFINDGLLRLGTATVSHRINEALQHTQAQAAEQMEAGQRQLVSDLFTLTDAMLKGIRE